MGSIPKDISRENSQCEIKGNLHFMKKLPHGAEASSVLIGEVDFLSHHITAFVRLKNACILGDLTEVCYFWFDHCSIGSIGFQWLIIHN